MKGSCTFPLGALAYTRSGDKGDTANIGRCSFLGYVYTESDMFRSVWDQIHYGMDSLCLHRTGSKLERYSSIWDHFHKDTHLVPDSRSYSYRIN